MQRTEGLIEWWKALLISSVSLILLSLAGPAAVAGGTDLGCSGVIPTAVTCEALGAATYGPGPNPTGSVGLGWQSGFTGNLDVTMDIYCQDSTCAIVGYVAPKLACTITGGIIALCCIQDPGSAGTCTITTPGVTACHALFQLEGEATPILAGSSSLAPHWSVCGGASFAINAIKEVMPPSPDAPCPSRALVFVLPSVCVPSASDICTSITP